MGEVLVRLGMPPAVPASPNAPKPREQYQRLAEQGQASDVIIARDTYKQFRKELPFDSETHAVTVKPRTPMIFLWEDRHKGGFGLYYVQFGL